MVRLAKVNGMQGTVMAVFHRVAMAALVLASTQADSASYRDCTDCPRLVVVPAGEARIGSTPEELAAANVSDRMAPRELPPRRVRFVAFALGVYPVTRGEFAAFVAATGHQPVAGCTVPKPEAEGFAVDPALSWRSPGFVQDDSHPVVCVSHNDATAYASWLARTTGKPYRLASEAEWEYAARAGFDRDRWWEGDAASVCRFVNGSDHSRAAVRRSVGGEDSVAPCDDGWVYTAKVDAFPLSPWGLSMIGNVREWVADCWVETHDGAPLDASPRQAQPCDYRALKGSSFDYPAAHLRAPTRYRYPQETRYPNIGFRIARDLAAGETR